MAFSPQNPSHSSNFSQSYLQRVQQFQSQANLERPTFRSSSVIVLDDDEEQTSSSLQTFCTNVPDFPAASLPTVDVENFQTEEATDLHITGVGVLQEWIDISELDVRVQIRRERMRKKIENIGRMIAANIQKKMNATDDSEVQVVGEMNENWADVNVVEEIEANEVQKGSDKPKIWRYPERKRPEPTGKEKFKCDQCDYRTDWKSNLNKHIVSRHQTLDEIKWFQCAHCPYKGKTKEYLRFHLKQCHEQFITWSQCPKCPQKFKTKQALEGHTISIHTAPEDIKWIECDECDFKCKFKMRLKDHKLFKHTKESDISWHKCRFCAFKGKTKRSLRMHEFNMHTDYDKMVWYKCEKCEYETTHKKNLRIHEKNQHLNDEEKEENDISQTPLECKHCGVVTVSKSKFREHFGWNGTTKLCYF